MKIINIEQNTDEWLEARKGKITGSKLKDILVKRGNKKKIGFYQLIADRIALDPTSELAMDRGSRLEEEALEKFIKKTGKKVDQVGFCISDYNPDIGVSPDGLIKENENYKEAVEVKCLSSANHIKAYLEQKIPTEYIEQALQYFIVIEELETLHFCFYDPRVSFIEFFIIQLNRSDLKEEIENLRKYQENTLIEINEIISKLTF